VADCSAEAQECQVASGCTARSSSGRMAAGDDWRNGVWGSLHSWADGRVFAWSYTQQRLEGDRLLALGILLYCLALGAYLWTPLQSLGTQKLCCNGQQMLWRGTHCRC